MNYPKCEGGPGCRFEHKGGHRTLMYSPITYDRDSNPVGGGCNKETRYIRCNEHSKNFKCMMTEFEWTTGVEPEWIEVDLNYGVGKET